MYEKETQRNLNKKTGLKNIEDMELESVDGKERGTENIDSYFLVFHSVSFIRPSTVILFCVVD